MNTTPRLLIIAGISLVSLAALAQEKKIERSELPPAVEKTVQAQSQGATIRGFSTESVDGKLYYEVSLLVRGHSRDVQIDPAGKVTEIEEELRETELPAEVRAGLTAKAGEGTITKVESLTKHDKIVAYEAQVMTRGKKSEIQVGPDGKPLDHEE
jgi:uncharacterized membrane protein YkoI